MGLSYPKLAYFMDLTFSKSIASGVEFFVTINILILAKIYAFILTKTKA